MVARQVSAQRLPKGPWSDYEDVDAAAATDAPPAAEQPTAEAPAQPWGAYAEPAPDAPPVMDSSGTQVEGGFSDELPNQPVSRMAPEDEQALQTMVSQGATASQVRQFAASKGFQYPNAEQVVEAFAKTGKINPDAVYQMPKPIGPDQVGALARGAADSLTMGALPKLNAAATAVGGALSGEGSFGDLYGRNLDTNNGIIEGDEENHPWARVAGQLLGGMALPSGMEGVGLKVGTDVLKAGGTMQEARVAAKIAVRNRMAAVGGAFGAAHGAGSEDTLGDAAGGALTEGVLGLATGGLLGQGGKAVKAEQKIAGGVSDSRDLIEAAQRQDIDPLPADVGGATARRLTSATAQTPFGAAPIIKAAGLVADQAQSARDRTAASVGQALNPEAAGQAAADGARKYIASSRALTGGMYRAAEGAAGGTRVPPTKALEALDANIAELNQVPGGAPGVDRLQGLRDSLATGDVTVGGLRNMRTVLRDQFIKDGLRGSDLERRVGMVLDAARDDISTGLRDVGKGDAAAMFARADAAYRERVTTIDQVIKPLIGTKDRPKSGEQITKALTADLQGNNARAVKFLAALPAEEQANTRASIIGALGTASKGTQNADGDAFSLSTFLTHWNSIGETAKRAFFGDEARAALNDLAKVAQASKEAATYANKSNTGGVNATLLTGMTALPTFGATVAAQYGLGHLLASPKFARWLARAPKTSLSPVAYADRLTRIARAEPAIANDVLGLQKQLVSAFSAAPMRAAAEQPGQELSGAQGNTGQQQSPAEDAQP